MGSRSGRARRPTTAASSSSPPREEDLNARAASLLFDMAAVQPLRERRRAYARGGRALLEMPRPLAEHLRNDRIEGIPYVGPAIGAILAEFLSTGRAARVDAAVETSGRRPDLEALRRLRDGFLSGTAVRAILDRRAPRAVSPADYRGDFQMHSDWSDGAASIDAMAEACIQRGYTCACLTDHSHGLAAGRGLSPQRLAAQRAAIDRVNARHRGRFRLFAGVEANIDAGGGLDLAHDELRRMDLAIASPHSLLRSSTDQTGRMVAAVSLPGVHILGHPRGRRYGVRAGVRADWRRVFEAAAARGAAIELDGFIDRQDVDCGLAREALACGCLFALDSDAHDPGELRYAAWAIAHARLARIPADRIVNCWDDERILEWSVRLKDR